MVRLQKGKVARVYQLTATIFGLMPGCIISVSRVILNPWAEMPISTKHRHNILALGINGIYQKDFSNYILSHVLNQLPQVSWAFMGITEHIPWLFMTTSMNLTTPTSTQPVKLSTDDSSEGNGARATTITWAAWILWRHDWLSEIIHGLSKNYR